MADKFYSMQHNSDGNVANYIVVADSTTAGSDIELRIELGLAWKTLEVVAALDAFKRHILSGVVSPQVLADV